ncbi:protein arginine N-methyltransferase 5, putative [Plasmodium gallinaceum]|uniref:Protein arginine N-methyltransferase n=1 Tax=Plasmodium gallinaceum TaxID=5849 RepID=A0A1J1GNU7_PLAGA|nr:protein arginine N-methyltransferase 5, putative [Plasmodium gallinaceum]CRG93966.1 protein arginine N-methyltransferase 5, putative [Plasmodium gallinaceum]
MPLKNKYGTLNIGIQCNYNEIENSDISDLNPDFIVSKLFKENKINNKLINTDLFLSENCLNEYKVTPLFGNKFEDKGIWNKNIYGLISDWIDTDNINVEYNNYCIDALNKELQWSSYISIQNLIINMPRKICDNYARCINSYIHNYNGVSIIVKIPLVKKNYDNRNNNCYEISDGWNLWAKFISYCNFNFSNLSVGIELVNLNDIEINNINLDIWKSEPVKLIIVPLDAFVSDSKNGYPYLPKKLKDFLIFFFRKNIDILLIDKNNRDFDSIEKKEECINGKFNSNFTFLKCCIYYLKRLFLSIENFDREDLFDNAYWDYLQIPLQPLKDNLPSQTYEIFERDKIKYEQYQIAICKYLSDELKKKNNNKKFIIFVVGAGRGPLVDSALLALEKNKITNFQIYAIEKNESAFLVLENRSLSDKWKNVSIIHSDMRYLDINEKADLIISELLGSFGDNELFPECLDGVQKFLKDGGVSIPKNCLSYVEPISCSHLYHKLTQNNFAGSNEIFYVVNLYSYCNISEERPKECFYFEIPNLDIKKDNTHNNRYKNINFKIKTDSYLHGFLCYFKSQLYDDIYISIEPGSHTSNLHSWYPLFIPMNKIIYLKKDQKLSFSIWRLTDNHKIWYEWCINEPITTNIHNLNARYFSIGR